MLRWMENRMLTFVIFSDPWNQEKNASNIRLWPPIWRKHRTNHSQQQWIQSRNVDLFLILAQKIYIKSKAEPFAENSDAVGNVGRYVLFVLTGIVYR